MTSENLPLVVAQAESRKNVINAAVSEAINSRVPDRSQMEPGRMYVGRLPNHNGPVLVRRRRKSFANPFGVPSVTTLWAPPRASSIDYHNATTTVYQPQPQPQMLVTQPPTYIASPQVVEPPAYLGLPAPAPIASTTTTTTTHEVQPQPGSSKYTCASCGKFRSARYHYRHPLATGENPKPTLCRKCIKQHTSSEEFDDRERAYWNKKKEQEDRHRRHHGSFSSEDWERSSSREERRRRHRYRSSNDSSRRHRRSQQSSSGVSNRIYIIRGAAEKRQPRSSSESVRVVRRIRSLEDRPRFRPLPRQRPHYGPFDGNHSYEEQHSDEYESDDFGHRGRSRSCSTSRHSHEDSHSVDEDYVRISTVSRRRPVSLLDRLTRSRSRSRSSSRNRWGRRRPDEYEEESVRITIHSREPSPARYERHEHEYEERIEDSRGHPWRRGSDSMIVHRGASTLETRGNDYFDRSRYGERSLGSSSGNRLRRVRSPSILRRRSMEHGMRDGRRVRFAHSDESEEGFRSAEQLLRERGFRHVRPLSPAPIHYESRRHRRISHSSHHDDDDEFGHVFDRGHLSPPIDSYSYARRRRSRSRERSDSYHGGGEESYESRRRVRVIDV